MTGGHNGHKFGCNTSEETKLLQSRTGWMCGVRAPSVRSDLEIVGSYFCPDMSANGEYNTLSNSVFYEILKFKSPYFSKDRRMSYCPIIMHLFLYFQFRTLSTSSYMCGSAWARGQ